MYDHYMIVGEEFKNVSHEGQVTGFQVGMRLPYYRGIVLSLIGNTDLIVDGEAIPRERMSVTISGKTLPLSALENESVVKWEFGDVGVLTVDLPGGLQPGEHTLELHQHLKISYVPVGFSGADKKVLSIDA
ncbi:MAG: hypothetical protein HUU38_09145 [Anaerolineales bacterium]|jgi:hypothetical protein|nr:hypothetical protein [Anaerolineales bacterium]